MEVSVDFLGGGRWGLLNWDGTQGRYHVLGVEGRLVGGSEGCRAQRMTDSSGRGIVEGKNKKQFAGEYRYNPSEFTRPCSWAVWQEGVRCGITVLRSFSNVEDCISFHP